MARSVSRVSKQRITSCPRESRTKVPNMGTSTIINNYTDVGTALDEGMSDGHPTNSKFDLFKFSEMEKLN